MTILIQNECAVKRVFKLKLSFKIFCFVRCIQINELCSIPWRDFYYEGNTIQYNTIHSWYKMINLLIIWLLIGGTGGSVKTLLALAVEYPFVDILYLPAISSLFPLFLCTVRSYCSQNRRFQFISCSPIWDLSNRSVSWTFSFSDGVIQMFMHPLSSVAVPLSPEKKPSVQIRSNASWQTIHWLD